MNKSRKYISKRSKNKRNKKTRKNIKGGEWNIFRRKPQTTEPDPEFIRKNKTYQKDVFILNILGMGCINNADPKRYIKEDAHNYFTKIDYEDLCISSNTTIGSKPTSEMNNYMNSLLPRKLKDQIVYHAATLKLGLNMTLLQKQHIIDELKNILENYKYLVIFGFSEGGAVANAIAESINNSRELDLERVFIKTFGSIYISNYTKNVKIENYLIPGDLSQDFNGKRSLEPSNFSPHDNKNPYFQKLNELSPTTDFISMDKNNSIIWIDNKSARELRANPDGKDKIPQFGLLTFGSQLGAKIHGLYYIQNHFITNVIELLYIDLKFNPQEDYRYKEPKEDVNKIDSNNPH